MCIADIKHSARLRASMVGLAKAETLNCSLKDPPHYYGYYSWVHHLCSRNPCKLSKQTKDLCSIFQRTLLVFSIC